MNKFVFLCFLFLLSSCAPDGNGLISGPDTADGEVVDTFSVKRPQALPDSDMALMNSGRAEADSIINSANALIVRSGDSSHISRTEEFIDADPDVAASFPGGEAAMQKYLAKHLVYPLVAFQNEIRGTVLLQVIVEKDGRISSVKVKKGIGYGCDESAIDCVKGMPVWSPAKNGGQPVKSTAIFPVSFGN